MSYCVSSKVQSVLPACRRTPAASYMTIELKARLTANRELPRPNSIAVAVVIACGFTLSYQARELIVNDCSEAF